jgi:hypothetical protein
MQRRSWAWTRRSSPRPWTKDDVTYLRILHLAASTLEADVAAALAQLQAAGTLITVEAVKALTAPAPPPTVNAFSRCSPRR